MKNWTGGKFSLEELELGEDWITLERHGPCFPKGRANRILYEAQLRSRVKTSQKMNKMETMTGRELATTVGQNWKSAASSKVKGFMWLFWNHALPVGERMFGSDPDRSCPRCGSLETYRHCMFKCKWVKETLDIVAQEWAMRAEGRYYAQTSWDWLTSLQLPGLKEEWAFVLKGISLQICWTDRCTLKYRGGTSPPPAIAANKILLTLNDTLRAREMHLRKLQDWWKHRQLVNKVTGNKVKDVLLGISRKLEKTKGLHWGRTEPLNEAGVVDTDGFIPFLVPEKGRFWALWTQDPPGAILESQG